MSLTYERGAKPSLFWRVMRGACHVCHVASVNPVDGSINFVPDAEFQPHELFEIGREAKAIHLNYKPVPEAVGERASLTDGP